MPARSAAVLLLLLWCPLALGQRAGAVVFRRLAIPEDVPAHLCSAIALLATRDGRLWIGTFSDRWDLAHARLSSRA